MERIRSTQAASTSFAKYIDLDRQASAYLERGAAGCHPRWTLLDVRAPAAPGDEKAAKVRGVERRGKGEAAKDGVPALRRKRGGVRSEMGQVDV